MVKNKVEKQLSPEETQILENILSLTQQLSQMNSAGATGEVEETNEENNMDIEKIMASVEGLTDEQKAALKKAIEVHKANAEEETGEKKTEDEQPGAKAKKAEDNTGAGSDGSDDAEGRVEDDNTQITQEAVDEVTKSMLSLTQLMKSLKADQDEMRKALEGVMETLGFDRALKSVSPDDKRTPVQEPMNIAKALVDEIRALKDQGGHAAQNVSRVSDREQARKALSENLEALVVRR